MARFTPYTGLGAPPISPKVPSGVAYCWGSNSIGQLGICNLLSEYHAPILVGTACSPMNTGSITNINTGHQRRTLEVYRPRLYLADR
jgi:hypothetical protein